MATVETCGKARIQQLEIYLRAVLNCGCEKCRKAAEYHLEHPATEGQGMSLDFFTQWLVALWTPHSQPGER